MTSKPSKDSYSKAETARRVEAALRAALNTPPQPLKSMTPKRSKAQRDSDPMPKDDPEALIAWGKLNIQRN
jgi:hypothetical protein